MSAGPLYELRHYQPVKGREAALLARFREHSFGLMKSFEIKMTEFWVGKRDGHIWYIVEWPDDTVRKAAWRHFVGTPEWKAVLAATEADGPLVEKVEISLLEKLPEMQAG